MYAKFRVYSNYGGSTESQLFLIPGGTGTAVAITGRSKDTSLWSEIIKLNKGDIVEMRSFELYSNGNWIVSDIEILPIYDIQDDFMYLYYNRITGKFSFVDEPVYADKLMFKDAVVMSDI